MKRACEGEGAKCDFSTLLCSGGLRCEPGAQICKPVPARAAATDAGEARR